MSDPAEMRSFIQGVLRDMTGNAVMSLATGRTAPTESTPLGKLELKEHHWFSYPAELDLMVEFATAERVGDQRNVYLSPAIYGDKHTIDAKSDQPILKSRTGRPMFSRSKDNALYTQTIYMDSDSCPPEAFRVEPSRHVWTSATHGQDYWFLVDPIPASMAGEIAHRITTAHESQGTDPNGWSDNKILRLPTLNTSYDPEHPFQVTFKDTGEVYNEMDISAAYEDVRVDVTPVSDAPMPPVPTIEGLPDFEEVMAKLPASNSRLHDLIFKVPRTGDGGWRSEQLFALLLDLQRAGLNDEETIAVAWHAPASSKFKVDSRGVEALWWQLQVKAKPLLAQERGETIEPAPPAPIPLEGPKLLTNQERARVANRSDLHSLYQAYARSRVQVFNAPYHFTNGWLVLAVTLGDKAIIPKDPKPMHLGFYSITIGKSSSGKTEAEDLPAKIIECMFGEDSPNMAGRHSKEALIETLIQRDGKVTYVQDDEADGLLGEIKNGGGPMSGIQQIWTRIYDGDVPPLGRVGRPELNVPGRRTVPVFNLLGTPSGILEVVDKSMYYKGFLARVMWTIGEDIEATEESVRTKFRSRGSVLGNAMPRWWASHLQGIRAKLASRTPLDQRKLELYPTDEALARIDAAKWKMTQHFESEYDMELWRTVVRRMGDVMWKIAGLSAISQARTIIGLRDVEVALQAAEIWIGNAVEIAERISDTYFSKQCDDIEKFIMSREGRRTDVGSIYRFRRGEAGRTTDEFLTSLTLQGRIRESSALAGQAASKYYEITRAKK